MSLRLYIGNIFWKLEMKVEKLEIRKKIRNYKNW